MEESLNDDVFRLPSHFLTDDDILGDKEYNPTLKIDLKYELKQSLSFPNEFPYEFDSLDSALSSPVESVRGSTETENTSDEEDFLAGLTRRLTHSSTQKLAVPVSLTQEKHEKRGIVAGSPESTLSGIGSWSGSSNESPNGPSLVSSPSTTPFAGQNETWDLISAAAGQVARLKMSNSSEAVNYNNNRHARSLLAPPKSSSPVHVIKTPNFGLYSGQSHHFGNANTNKYQQYMKQEAMLKTQCGGSVRGRQQVMRPTCLSQPQQIQNKARNFGYENARCGGPLEQLPQSARPLRVRQQYQQKPQQRPVFLGGSVAIKRECAGTGVFLPRRYENNPPESRKKSVPTKVVHALNLNFDDINVHSRHHQRFNAGFSTNYDALIARRNALVTLPKRSLRPDVARNHEIYLPHEWTY